MNFNNPNFLFFIPAIAIPILIHFISLKKKETELFSNVNFLEKIELIRRRKSFLENLILLITRILIFLLIIFAFSDPVKKNTSLNTSDNIILYVDNSHSMSVSNDNGIIFEQAKNIARNIIQNENRNKKYLFIDNNFNISNEKLISSKKVLEKIDQLQITSKSLNFKDILEKKKIMKNYTNSTKLFFISDFQNIRMNELFDLKPKIEINLIHLEQNKFYNLSLDTCYVSNNENFNSNYQLSYKITNHSDKDFFNIPVKLDINAQKKGISSINIKSRTSSVGKINFKSYDEKKECLLTINDKILIFDNELYFNLNDNIKKRVLIISDSILENNDPVISIYKDSIFKYENHLIKRFNNIDLNQFDLIILNSIYELKNINYNKILKYLSTNKNLFIIPHPKHNSENNFFLKKINLPTLKKLIIGDFYISDINFENKVFKNVFSKKLEQNSLPKVYKYFEIENKHIYGEILIQINNGDPFILSSSNPGKSYIITSPLMSSFNQLYMNSIFIPLMYNITMKENPKGYYTVGYDNVQIIENEKNLKLTGSKYEFFPNAYIKNNTFKVNLGEIVFKSGFFKLKNNEMEKNIAYNYDRIESKNNFLTKNDLEKISKNNDKINFYFDNKKIPNFKESSSKNLLWYHLIFYSLIFLVIESLLIKFKY